MEIENSEINDIRDKKEFKGVTFSNFKKADVKKELLQNLYLSKIEPCCYWSSELICAGHYGDLWDIIIEFYTKHIHIGNPKLVIYLVLRINNFKDIIHKGFVDQELRLRNNSKIRKLFCEIMCVLCESKKKHSYDEVKIKKLDFDLNLITDQFKAPNTHYGDEIVKKDDPKDLFIPINELYYNVSLEGKNSVNACYWLEWIIEYENICKIQKEKCKCERRTFCNVDTKLQMDLVWIIWEIFLLESTKRSNLIEKIIHDTLIMFTLKYTYGCHKKRKSLLYFVISILTEPVNLEEEMIKEKQKIMLATANIDNIYKQIKVNEHSPGTDYLYKNVKSTNLEKTIAKLEKMNTFGTDFIPRLRPDDT